jgi:hypothetical protein
MLLGGLMDFFGHSGLSAGQIRQLCFGCHVDSGLNANASLL